MSLFSNLFTVYVDQLFTEITRLHSIPRKDLDQINKSVVEKFKITFSAENVKKQQAASKKKEFDVSAVDAATTLAAADLKTCTRDELVKLCKIKGLRSTGTKDEMVKRLTSTTPVIEKFLKCSPINIELNEFGNRMHEPTKLVFSEDKVAIGYQLDDGTVAELDDEMIDRCNQYKFKYKLPQNLDKNIKTEDIDNKLSKLIDEDDEDDE